MGNSNGREEVENGKDDRFGRSNGESGLSDSFAPVSLHPGLAASSDSMSHSPPESPGRTRSPVLFAPQVPVAPLQTGERSSFFNQMLQNEPIGSIDIVPEPGIPTMITWNHDGNDVAVEGSWDSWRSRKALQRCGKDHTVLLVLPSGIYHYKFIVDGERRYIPDLPHMADEMGNVSNLLDVNDYVPENLESVSEFENPPSPDSSYGQAFPPEEEFAKEPVGVPSQLHVTVLGTENSEVASAKPQHVVLNHVFIEKGWASQPVVALGLTQVSVQIRYCGPL